MLIDATHPEETRVVVVRGNRVEEFDFETAQRRQLRGNIYLAKVTRVEPSLQAAFIEYGGNRHGFLAFSEIHPDYYQIPVADRQALIEAEEQAHREAEEESESSSSSRRRSRHRGARRRSHGGERIQSDLVEGLVAETTDVGHVPITEHGEPLPHHGIAHDGEHSYADSDPHEGYEPHEFGHYDAAHGDVADDAGRRDADAAPADGDDAPHDVDHDHDGEDHEDASEADDAGHHPAFFDSGQPFPVPGDDDAQIQPSSLEAEAERGLELVTSDLFDSFPPSFSAESTAVDSVITDPGAAPAAESGAMDAVREAGSAEDSEGDDAEEIEEDVVESVGGNDVLEEVPERPFRPRRQYKIQEVIKRRQVMLVQVVKEERGNKGAALTTYLSLAGRYAVLMPNTARGGGISRKITSAQDRMRLKEVVQELDVPEGMGIILRTAGASRTKPEIKRDFEYLIRMWETVRDLTLNSQAPTLVYEEGSLIKRSLRDLFNKEIDEILVAGDSGYREARDFMKMLMPPSVRAVKQYRDGQPLFSRMGVESQLDAMFSPTVQLRSGGYLVINQTEALVSIDVNSGRSTREHHIEDTALKTNLEAAEEVARQLRLRDLAGLIVIDFIDMDEKRNNRAVERKLSDCLRQDRARIQVGRISHFGLLEMSRQRIRASVLESSTEPCPHCSGTGHVRSVSSVALQLLRGLEEVLMKGATHNLVVHTRTEVALYVLNHKRGHLRNLEDSFKVTLSIIADQSVTGPQSFIIERGDQVHTLEAAKALLASQIAAGVNPIEENDNDDDGDVDFDFEVEDADSDDPAADGAAADPDGQRRKRRRRRRGRVASGRDFELREDSPPASSEPAPGSAEPEEENDGGEDSEESEGQAGLARDEQAGNRRKRGRRGGRRRRSGMPDEGLAGSISDDIGLNDGADATEAGADFAGMAAESQPASAWIESPVQDQPQDPEADPLPAHLPVQVEIHLPTPLETERQARVRAPREKAAEAPVAVSAPQTAAEPAVAETAAETEPSPAPRAPRRRSTVREKVGFTSQSQADPIQTEPTSEQPPSVETTDSAPVASDSGDTPSPRAGWWSRRESSD